MNKINPHTIYSRKSIELNEYIVKNNLLDAVIAMPPEDTHDLTYILIFNKSKKLKM